MTAADHANTVREALTRRGTASFQYPPNEALAALDALAAQAEQFHRHVETMIEPKLLERAEAAEAERDAAVQAAEQAARKAEAYDAARARVKREGLSRAEYVLRAEAAEQAAEQAQAALREIERFANNGASSGHIGFLARAALAGNQP